MPVDIIKRYYIDVRFENTGNERRSFHINACSECGAIYQTTLLLKKNGIKQVYSILVREEAYPIEKRKRLKTLKEKKKHFTIKRDNEKAIDSIKARLESQTTKS
jgi:hypothetical protein